MILSLYPKAHFIPSLFIIHLHLQLYTVSLVVMWFLDVIWLALWAHRIDQGKVRALTLAYSRPPTYTVVVLRHLV